MKKLLAVLMGSVMILSAAAGLAACRNEGDGPGPGPNPGGETKAVRRDDPRDQEAFEMHAPDGALVSKHVSLAAAVNAAVENDLDTFEAEDVEKGQKGSYVTRKGDPTKVFENSYGYKNGDLEQGYSFWSYDKNGALLGDEIGVSPIKRFQNQDAYALMSYGDRVEAALAGVTLYDGQGNVIEQGDHAGNKPESPGTCDISQRNWELNPASDALIRCVGGGGFSGATGARYTIDLSNTKIRPPYKGVEDKAFAFMGYYMGDGSARLEVGIACDTETGDWYQFWGHASGLTTEVKNEYNVGERLMTSTWHDDKEGGYFTPDCTELELDMHIRSEEDDVGDKVFFDEFKAIIDGKTTVVRIRDEEVVEYGGGASYKMQASFYFTAGLDLVAPGAEIGDPVAAVDYTVGASFENFVVEKAEIYFPGYDEISDEEWGSAIEAELRGEDGEGKYWPTYPERFEYLDGNTLAKYNYTIVQNSAFIDYEQNMDEADVYTFSYIPDLTAPKDALGGELKTYQDRINKLKAINAENAETFETELEALREIYGPTGAIADAGADLKDKAYIYFMLDWQPLLDAEQVYKNALKLSEAGEKLLKEYETLTAIDSLTGWKGWKAPEGTADTTGYLYNELQKFGPMLEEFNALPEAEQPILKRNAKTWDTWATFYTQYTVAVKKTNNVVIWDFDMLKSEEVSVAEALDVFFGAAMDAWTLRDDPTRGNPTTGNSEGDYRGQGLLCTQSMLCFKQTFRILSLANQLPEVDGVKIDYIDTFVDLLGSGDATVPAGNVYSEGAIKDFAYLWHVGRQLGRIIREECFYLDKELADTINDYMVGFKFGAAAWSYQWSHAANHFTNMFITNYECYNLIDPTLTGTKMKWGALLAEYLQPILVRDGGGIELPAYAGGKAGEVDCYVPSAVTALAEAPEGLELTPENLIGTFNSVGFHSLHSLDGWLGGWSMNAETQNHGWVSWEIAEFRKIYLKFETFGPEDQQKIIKGVGESVWNDWVNLSTQWAALEALENDVEKTVPVVPGGAISGTPNPEGFYHSTPLNTLRAVFNQVFKYVGETDHAAGCGKFLCMEDDLRMRDSLRGLYLWELSKQQGQLDFLDEVMDLIKKDAYGAKVLKDWEYLCDMGGQIVRVMEKGVDKLDADLANVLNKYVAADGKYGTNNAFQTPALSKAYLQYGALSENVSCGYHHYFALNLPDTKTWSQLMEEYIVPLVGKDKMLPLTDSASSPLVLKETVPAPAAAMEVALPERKK